MERGHKVILIRPRQKDEKHNRQYLNPELCSEQVVVTGAPLPGYSAELRFGLVRAARLSKLFKKYKPDAVYVATQGPLGVAAVQAADGMPFPVVSGFHTNFHAYSRYYGAGFLESMLCRYGRWFHNRTDCTLTPTRAVYRQVQEMGIYPVEVWGRGVDCERFNPRKRSQNLRAKWGLAENDPAVIYVGRLAAEKNLHLATAAYERLKSLHPRARLILVGDGPLKAGLQQRCPQYIFAGLQQGESLAAHYASGDIFLFPSKTDTFGNVVAEAMASGLGVVAFDDAAAREHIRHEENGVKAPLGDDEGFISCALRLADQRTLLNRVRHQARMDALQLDWLTKMDQFEQILFKTPKRVSNHAVKQSIPNL